MKVIETKTKTIIVASFGALIATVIIGFVFMWVLFHQLDETVDEMLETSYIKPNTQIQHRFYDEKIYSLAQQNEDELHETFYNIIILCILSSGVLVFVGVVVFKKVTGIEKQLIDMCHDAIRMSEVDALTGLLNRRGFEKRVDTLITNKRNKTPNVMMSLDLDKFKIINDSCGHASGDKALVKVASIFEDCVRDTDLVARMGGDEFGIILKDCTLEKGKEIAENILYEIGNFKHACSGNIFNLGVSIGMILTPDEPKDIKRMYHAVDVALYIAKGNGRGRIEITNINNVHTLKCEVVS